MLLDDVVTEDGMVEVVCEATVVELLEVVWVVLEEKLVEVIEVEVDAIADVELVVVALVDVVVVAGVPSWIVTLCGPGRRSSVMVVEIVPLAGVTACVWPSTLTVRGPEIIPLGTKATA